MNIKYKNCIINKKQRRKRKCIRLTKIFIHITGITNSVPWSRIHPHLRTGKIKTIFLGYDYIKLKKTKVSDIISDLRSIKCGNISDKRQVASLKYNIEQLEKIITDNGSIENYFKLKCKKYPIIEYSDLNDFQDGGKYKLEQMGIPLVCEFLKNMGYDLPKTRCAFKKIFK